MLIVGGNWNNGANAGVRAANANNSPGNANTNIGFRLSIVCYPSPGDYGRRPVYAHTTPKSWPVGQIYNMPTTASR